MQKLTIFNTREVKKIKEILREQFNHAPTQDYAYLQNEKNKIFLINKDLSKINIKNLRIDKMGFYFAEYKNNSIRLSKEGAQLLLEDAAKNGIKLKNTLILTKEEVKNYFTGVDLIKNLGENPHFLLLLYDNTSIGCAKYKEGKIINFLPKMNRGEVII